MRDAIIASLNETLTTAMNNSFKPILLAIKTVNRKLTPSVACKSEYAVDFSELMSILTISTLNDLSITEPFVECNTSTCEYPAFIWEWNERNEKESYDYVLKYLLSIGMNAKCIANGENLTFGNLYDVEIYNLRPRCKYPDEVANLSYSTLNKMFTLSGRSDIIVMKRLNPCLNRMHCEFVIEIKTVLSMQSRGNVQMALREACLQLIGLNVDNPVKSPAVILTNLVGKNYVLYLDICDNPDIELAYSVKVLRFKLFRIALWYVENNLANRSSCTGDFGRRPSITNSIDVDIEAVTVEFDNVCLRETMDVDQLEGI